METGTAAKLWNTIRSLSGEERRFAWIAAAGFCLLLAAYTVLRPIRDEFGIRGGVENLQWSFTFTFLGMLVCVPLFGAAASKLPKRSLIPIAYGFFVSHLVLFALILNLGVQPAWFAQVFFSWVSIFNLIVISLFWTTLSDRCSEARGRILFGPVAAGGSVGAFLGPLLTSQLVRAFGAPALLLLSAVLLTGAAMLVVRIPVLGEGLLDRGQGKVLQGEVIGGEMWQGLSQIPGSRFLQQMAVLTFVGNVLGTYLYFEQATILSTQIPDPVRRTELLAYVDLSVNCLSLLFQVFLAPFCLNVLPARFAFSIVPATLLLGFPLLAIFPFVPVLFGFQIIRRASLYALAKPVESLLFAPRSDQEGYKARNVIDTLIYRMGDTSGAWMMSALRQAGALFAFQLLTPIAAALMLIITYSLGRGHEATVAKESTTREAGG